jgi:hypothetical protein
MGSVGILCDSTADLALQLATALGALGERMENERPHLPARSSIAPCWLQIALTMLGFGDTGPPVMT